MGCNPPVISVSSRLKNRFAGRLKQGRRPRRNRSYACLLPIRAKTPEQGLLGFDEQENGKADAKWDQPMA